MGLSTDQSPQKDWSGSAQGYEAFANMTEGLVNRGDKLYEDLLKAFVPNFSRWYDDLLNEVFKRAEAIK